MPTDSTLTCRDCGQTFTFTSGEREFFASRGYSEPTRCPDCRARRKAERAGGPTYGGGFNLDERGQRVMYRSTCAGCGQEALVPFQPREDRPVYCSECFEQRRAARSGGGRSRARARF
jgi:CxxC-x17-CxxC domain-containing protein